LTAIASPPTSRVVDVMSLFARSGTEQLRFSDIARELQLTQATANAILKTLCDRRWLSRDPVDKTYAIGPEFIVLAAQADASRALAHDAREVALEIASSTGYATSVTELVDDSLVITGLHATADVPTALLGDRFPYAPPFGVAFAAWETEDQRTIWVHRATIGNGLLEERLYELLALTRDRGYHVDQSTPAMLQMTQIAGTLHGTDPTPAMRRILEELLTEMVDTSSDTSSRIGEEALVTTIAAPVFDQRNRVAFNVSVHPIRPLSTRQIEQLGRRLRKKTAAVGAAQSTRRSA
jgi:DNA-binding IclR family transcriptional regulator